MNELSFGKQFEDIVYQIFESYKLNDLNRETLIDQTTGYRADITFRIGNKTYIVEIKHYRTKNIQYGLIKRAVEQLENYKNYADFHKLILVTSNVLDNASRSILKAEYPNIIFIGINDLILSCHNEIERERLKAIIDFDVINQGAKISEMLGISDSSNSNSISNNATQLLNELKIIKAGHKNYNSYEDLCSRIIKFLFSEEVIKEEKQLSTSDGLSRYDFIARISPKTAFWKFIVEEIGSRYVVFEFKNYKDEITQQQILTTEKYLLSLALRKVAFIFCRKGYSNSAKKMLDGALRESGKVIFVLNDRDLEKMLEMKDSGSDPSDYLFDKADELFMKLSR